LEYLGIRGERGSLESLLPSGLSKPDLIGYMRSCPVVLFALKLLPDQHDPKAEGIPVAYLTDGEFVWFATTTEYVDRYDFGLPEHFLRHVSTYRQTNGDEPRTVPKDLQDAALRFIRQKA